MATVLFYVFAGLALLGALMMVTRANPVAAVLWLVASFFGLAGVYTLLHAYFVGVIQVLVYAGAIMVLFLFVIMLLNLGHPNDPRDFRGPTWRGIGLAAAVALALVLGLAILDLRLPLGRQAGLQALLARLEQQGVVGAVGVAMYTDFAVPLQITGLLLLVAIVGAIVLAKRDF